MKYLLWNKSLGYLLIAALSKESVFKFLCNKINMKQSEQPRFIQILQKKQRANSCWWFMHVEVKLYNYSDWLLINVLTVTWGMQLNE